MGECHECGANEDSPFTCNYCDFKYYGEHRFPENYDCPGLVETAGFTKHSDSSFDDSVGRSGSRLSTRVGRSPSSATNETPPSPRRLESSGKIELKNQGPELNPDQEDDYEEEEADEDSEDNHAPTPLDVAMKTGSGYRDHEYAGDSGGDSEGGVCADVDEEQDRDGVVRYPDGTPIRLEGAREPRSLQLFQVISTVCIFTILAVGALSSSIRVPRMAVRLVVAGVVSVGALWEYVPII